MCVRILIADDHPVVRSGIRNELIQYSDFVIVGEAENGDQAYSLVCERDPDILLLDINMPGMRAVDVIQKIKNQDSTCQVIVLTAFGDSGMVTGMLKAGAVGYLLKDEDPKIISEAIRKVKQGKMWLSQSAMSAMVEAVRDSDEIQTANIEFTPREKKVLSLMCDGKKNREIALLICTSERTVEYHVSNILRKMGAKTRIEAILMIQKKGGDLNQ